MLPRKFFTIVLFVDKKNKFYIFLIKKYGSRGGNELNITFD